MTLLSYGLSVNAVTGANLTDSSAALSGAELHKGALAHTVRNGTRTFRVNEGHIIGPNGQPFIATGLSTYCEPGQKNRYFDARLTESCAIERFPTGSLRLSFRISIMSAGAPVQSKHHCHRPRGSADLWTR